MLHPTVVADDALLGSVADPAFETAVRFGARAIPRLCRAQAMDAVLVQALFWRQFRQRHGGAKKREPRACFAAECGYVWSMAVAHLGGPN